MSSVPLSCNLLIFWIPVDRGLRRIFATDLEAPTFKFVSESSFLLSLTTFATVLCKWYETNKTKREMKTGGRRGVILNRDWSLKIHQKTCDSSCFSSSFKFQLSRFNSTDNWTNLVELNIYLVYSRQLTWSFNCTRYNCIFLQVYLYIAGLKY